MRIEENIVTHVNAAKFQDGAITYMALQALSSSFIGLQGNALTLDTEEKPLQSSLHVCCKLELMCECDAVQYGLLLMKHSNTHAQPAAQAAPNALLHCT